MEFVIHSSLDLVTDYYVEFVTGGHIVMIHFNIPSKGTSENFLMRGTIFHMRGVLDSC